MFIAADIYEREANGALKDFARIAEDLVLLDQDQVPVRFLWLTPEVIASIAGWERECRLGALAEMVDFLIGETVYWGDLRDGNHLKPLDPETGWIEFKVRTSPQVRIYGAFVDTDCFIALHACKRCDQPEDIDAEFSGLWLKLWGEDAPRLRGAEAGQALTNYRTRR